jgi:hypothetical protein
MEEEEEDEEQRHGDVCRFEELVVSVSTESSLGLVRGDRDKGLRPTGWLAKT